MDVRKAYGIVAAVGAKLGVKAREDEGLVPALREAPDVAAFRDRVRDAVRGLLPDALVESFVSEVVTDADWRQWRARLLVQVKMTRDGKAPAPGHEKGRGVGRP
jgi:hypothetical protein